jgi:hypothetical protein
VPKPIAGITYLSLLTILVFGCSLFKGKQPTPPPPQPSPTATPTPESTPTPTPHRHRRRHHHNHAASPASEGTPTPTPTPEESPNPTPTASLIIGAATPTPSPTPALPARVSIGDDSADQSHVGQLLAEARANLAEADPASLTGDDAAAYHQAKSLLSAAEKARNQGDYLAASGLAQKAAVLSGRFAGAVPP